MKNSIPIDEHGLLDFTCQLVRTPSVSGQEARVAAVVAEEMKKLDYDEVSIDEKHSVLGRLKGSGEGKSILLNGHIDHAEVGTMRDPFDPQIMDGSPFGYPGKVIRGRGTTDMKGAVAAMIYGAAAVKKAGEPLKGDVWVVANSLEEPARGEGILHILKSLNIRADMAVNTEATGLTISIGQTGRMDFKVIAKGVICHGAFPEKGKNAIYEMSRFLNTFLQRYQTPEHEMFGKIPYAVIGISSSPPPTTPVVPDRCEIVLLRRFLPGETKKTVQPGIEEIIHIIKNEDPSFEADVEYLGELPSFYCEPSEEIVSFLQGACRRIMGEEVPIGTWRFGTDAGYLMQLGIPCVGFGPGFSDVAHTPDEFVPVDHLLTASRVYAELIRSINGHSA